MPRDLPFRTDIAYFAGRADGLLASAQDGTDGAILAFFRERAPITADGARTAVARRHGCATWTELEAHLATISADDPFVAAFRAIEAADAGALTAALDRAPTLVLANGTNGNDLLGIAAGTGDVALVTPLLARGADVTHANVHGWTALHAAAMADAVDVVDLLLATGAPTDVSGRGDGGTPLVAALFWGKVAAAERIAAVDLAPGNLRVAAGLGRLDLIAALRDTPQAGAHRGFTRPHGGFPAWTPDDDPAAVVDEALAWAARNDRAEAVDALAAAGARLDADVARGTALVWAAALGCAAAAARLLALGADPSGRSGFGGPEHGVAITPLHVAAAHGDVEMVGLLLAAGADPTVRDARYDGTPAGWAQHAGQAETLALLAG